MDGPDVALALLFAFVPALLWLACGVVVSVGKQTLANVRLGRFRKKVVENGPVDDDGSKPKVATIVLVVIFDGSMIVLETVLGVLRTTLTYAPLVFLFFFTLTLWYVCSRHTAAFVFTFDAFYESVRPNIVEVFIQSVNFGRVIFDLLIGIWNALINFSLVTIRVLFDAAFECGGVSFVQNVASKGAAIVSELAVVLTTFFTDYAADDVFDVNITALSARSREFTHAFVDVVECSCVSISKPVLRTAMAPLWLTNTDIFANGAARTVVKTLEIPLVFMTTGETSFEPLFDAVLAEESGFLAAGGDFFDAYLKAVVDFVQSGIPENVRMGSPPLFSIVRRLIAMPVVAVRTVTRLIASLPELLGGTSRQASDLFYDAGSMHDLTVHADKIADLLFVDTLVSVHEYLEEFGAVMASLIKLTVNVFELSYNTTVVAAGGIPAPEYASGSRGCETKLAHSDNPIERIRFGFLYFARKYTTHSVPLQMRFALDTRKVVVDKFLAVAVAESLYAGLLTIIHFVEGYVNVGAYAMDALLRLRDVRHNCVSGFLRRGHERALDTIESLPDLITSALDFKDTTDSGYASLVCSRSTHVNHVYSGSLKQYVLASSACDAVYEETGEMPKCNYRDDNPERQNDMCARLIAFSDYNSNLMCNAGDVLVELAQSWLHAYRTIEEYYIGLYVAIWNCVNNPLTLSGFADCASSVTRELVPPQTGFDLLECQSAELFYRFSTFAVSIFSPVFEAIYRGIGYPDDGYVAVGVDDFEHVQAKPIEAALSTFVTSLMAPHWIVHVISYIGRESIVLLQGLHTDPSKFDDILVEVFKFRFEIMSAMLRASVLFLRDVLVGALQVGRTVSTLVEYYHQSSDEEYCKRKSALRWFAEPPTFPSPPPPSPSPPPPPPRPPPSPPPPPPPSPPPPPYPPRSPYPPPYRSAISSSGSSGSGRRLLREVGSCVPDPKQADSTFAEFQAGVIAVVKMAQEFVELFTDIFFEGIESMFKCLFILIKGLMTGDAKLLREFFVTLVDELAKNFTALLKGFVGILFSEGSPLSFMCNIVNTMKTVTCQVLGLSFIPSSLSINCGKEKNQCSWWPFSGDETIQSGARTSSGGDTIPNTGHDFSKTVTPSTKVGFVPGLKLFNRVKSLPPGGWYESFPFGNELPAGEVSLTTETKITSADIRADLRRHYDIDSLITTDGDCDPGIMGKQYSNCYWEGKKSFTDEQNKILNTFDHRKRLEHMCTRHAVCLLSLDDEELSSSKGNCVLFASPCQITADETRCESGTTFIKRWISGSSVSYEHKTYRAWGPIRLRIFENCAQGTIQGGRKLQSVTAEKDLQSTAAFRAAMEERDPDQRRRLLWGWIPYGDEIKEKVEGVVDTVTAPVTEIANTAKRVGNYASDLADKAKNAVNDAIDKATELADVVAKLPQKIWDSVYTMIPTEFEASTKSILELGGSSKEAFGCNEEACPKDTVTAECPSSQEATVCSQESDCVGSGSFCVTADQDLCPGGGGETNSKACKAMSNWAKACQCSALRDDDGPHPYHCDYATGFCSAGPTPFKPPLTECADSGGLIYGTAGYEALCMIAPLWECAEAADKESCRSHVGLRLQGPSLCRAFCGPTFENRNNRLAQYQYDDGERRCVCEVGVDRVFGADPVSIFSLGTANGTTLVRSYSPPSPPPLAPSPPPSRPPSPLSPPPFIGVGKKRRELLDEEDVKTSFREVKGVFTRCESNAQCASSFSEPTICKSLWDLPITCYSCSERVHGAAFSAGHECDAQTKTCRCTAPKVVDPEDERARPDDDEWRGNSWCDKIMRGYRMQAVRSPLENVWIHRCSRLRVFGISLTQWLGVPTVPPDIVYNPERALKVGVDIVEGVYLYFSEGWSKRTDDEDFFNRLIERRVDPIIIFKVLDFGQKTMGIGRAILEKVDIVETVGTTLDILEPAASLEFRRGVSQTSRAARVFIDVVREHEAGAIVLDAVVKTVVKTKTLVDIMKNATAPTTNATAPTTNATAPTINATAPTTNATAPTTNATGGEVSVVAVLSTESNVPALVDDDPHLLDVQRKTRALLDFSFECLVLTNAKNRAMDIGDFLARYYGSKNAFLGASLCSYEAFLTTDDPPEGCPKTGQSAFPMEIGDNLTVGGGLGRITMSDLQPLRLRESLDDWLSQPKSDLFRKIIGFTKGWSNAAVGCDAETLLCQRQKRSLLEGIVLSEVWIFLILSMLLVSGINFLSASFFFTSQFVALPVLVMFLTYSFPTTCFPRVPTCLADEFFELMTTALPLHIPWSPFLARNATRVSFSEYVWFEQLDADIVDCREEGFHGFFDPFFWARENTRGQGFDVLWTIVEWPLITIVPGARTSSKQWRDREITRTIDECAKLTLPGVFPPVIIVFFMYIVLSFSTVPAIRFAKKILSLLFPLVVSACTVSLDIYNT